MKKGVWKSLSSLKRSGKMSKTVAKEEDQENATDKKENTVIGIVPSREDKDKSQEDGENGNNDVQGKDKEVAPTGLVRAASDDGTVAGGWVSIMASEKQDEEQTEWISASVKNKKLLRRRKSKSVDLRGNSLKDSIGWEKFANGDGATGWASATKIKKKDKEQTRPRDETRPSVTSLYMEPEANENEKEKKKKKEKETKTNRYEPAISVDSFYQDMAPAANNNNNNNYSQQQERETKKEKEQKAKSKNEKENKVPGVYNYSDSLQQSDDSGSDDSGDGVADVSNAYMMPDRPTRQLGRYSETNVEEEDDEEAKKRISGRQYKGLESDKQCVEAERRKCGTAYCSFSEYDTDYSEFDPMTDGAAVPTIKVEGGLYTPVDIDALGGAGDSTKNLLRLPGATRVRRESFLHEPDLSPAPKEETLDLAKRIEKASPELLKKILLSHAKDQRKHLLSEVEDSLVKEEKAKAKASTLDGEGYREWNEEMQGFLKNGITGLSQDDIGKIARLGHDFVRCAEFYAKIIISELCVATELKTIKPAGVGGIAGGEKYIVHGILFKFCLDQIIQHNPPMYMYGGDRPCDEYAMKVGGLELQGLEAWTSQIIPGLCFPLMALIDYKGFRVVATSLLPLGSDTLRYGSSDGGRTVLASDMVLNNMIEQAGKKMNLKKHRVGTVELCAPGDIEGHLGKDGRYYLLDFARTMPPEAPTVIAEYTKSGKIPRSVFYRMLRPELVASNPVPLSSDTFSAWGLQEKDRLQSQREVEEATRRIFTECIPSLVDELLALDLDVLSGRLFSGKSKPTAEDVTKMLAEIHLPARMHMHGVNLRHMGFLRKQMMGNEYFQGFLLALAVARVLKSALRERLRAVIRTHKMSESSCKRLVADFFNQMLLGSDNSDLDSWSFKSIDIRKELEKKFNSILTHEEKEEPLEKFKARIDPRLVISECLHLQIMKISPEVTKAIYKTTGDYSSIKLLESDIVELCARVRHTHNYELWHALELQRKAKECIEGKAFMVYERMQALMKGSSELAVEKEEVSAEKRLHQMSPADKRQARRLLNRAQQNLYQGNLSYPLCPMSTLLWGDVLADLSKICEWEKAQRCFAQAYEKFERTEKLVGVFGGLYFPWANCLREHAKRAEENGQPDLAKALREQAAVKEEKALATMMIAPCGKSVRPFGEQGQQQEDQEQSEKKDRI